MDELTNKDYSDFIDRLNNQLDKVDTKIEKNAYKVKWRRLKAFFRFFKRKSKEAVDNLKSLPNWLGIAAGTAIKSLLFTDGGNNVHDCVKTKHLCLCNKKIDIDMFFYHIENECDVFTKIDNEIDLSYSEIDRSKNEVALANQNSKNTEIKMLKQIEELTKRKKANLTIFNTHINLLRDISLLYNENVKKTITKEKKKQDYIEKLKNTHGLKKILLASWKGLSKAEAAINILLKIGVAIVAAYSVIFLNSIFNLENIFSL